MNGHLSVPGLLALALAAPAAAQSGSALQPSTMTAVTPVVPPTTAVTEVARGIWQVTPRLGKITGIAAAIAAVGACADGDPVRNEQGATAMPARDAAQDVASAWNGSWITLSGRVVGTGPDRFQLDYGSGRITVEMDDWDWFHEGRELLPGDEVTVTGRIDKDLYEQKKIEASSVYVKNLGAVFQANPQDEEDIAGTTVYVPGTPGWVVATGTVKGVEGREFSLGGGGADLRVDTAKMIDDPLDTQGKFQVKTGDRVQV